MKNVETIKQRIEANELIIKWLLKNANHKYVIGEIEQIEEYNAALKWVIE